MADLALPALSGEAVRLNRTAADRHDAIRQTGEALLAIGAVQPGYLDAMQERESTVTTYIGEGVAIPHGTHEARALVHRTALAYLQFPDGVDWGDGQRAHVCVGIAARDDDHLGVLSALARILLDPDKAARLRGAATADDVVRLLQPTGKENKPA